jgi:protein TonB
VPPPPIVDWFEVEVVPEPADETAPASMSAPDAALPDLPEPPTREVTPDFALLPSTPRPNPDHTTPTLTIRPFGDPDGRSGAPGPGGPGPISSVRLDHPPHPRSQVAPVYPYEARRDGRKGEVLVEFVVNEAGCVVNPHVLRSNDPVFEAPTLRAVAKWRFEPGRNHGRVVRFRMAVPVEFSLESEGGT